MLTTPKKPLCLLAVTSIIPVVAWPGARVEASSPKPDHVFDDGTEVYFLGKRDGAKAIVEDDPDGFFDHLTAMDMAVRIGHDLKSNDLDAERASFKKFVARNVRNWTAAEKKKLLANVETAHARCKASLPALLPKAWRFIKTTGDVEGAPYTRGSAIVLPAGELNGGVDEHLLIHELFHVYARSHPAKRRELYGAIGFRELPAVAVPPALQRKRLTNPDGADINWAIKVNNDGHEVDVVPVIFSRYDERRDGITGVFGYVDFGLFEVRESGGKWALAVDRGGDPLAPLSPAVEGFFQQIGHNTFYIIHPDEILADNVALLVLASDGKPAGAVATPELLDRIKQIMESGTPG